MTDKSANRVAGMIMIIVPALITLALGGITALSGYHNNWAFRVVLEDGRHDITHFSALLVISCIAFMASAVVSSVGAFKLITGR